MAKRSSRDRSRPVDLSRYRRVIPDWDAFLEAAARPEPTVFRVRTGRVAEDELVARLERQGFAVRPVEGLPTFYRVVDEPRPVSLTLEHWHGLIYVQQASTGVAAPALGARPGERVLDLCSAPGGKTTHLAELMEDRGCLVACEIDERRIRGLLGNVYRLGHPCVLVVAGDGRDFPEGAPFDRALVDAPCSGEGTLRRRAGEPPRQSKSFLGYVTATQRALLQRALRAVRPGGTVLYVTCTFSPEENEAVVSDALAAGDADLVPLDLPVPHAPGLTSFDGASFDERLAGAARIYPQHLDSGGLFLAKLRRAGQAEEPPRDDDGWSSVPAGFDAGEEEVVQRLPQALDVVAERYGIEAASHPEWGWMVRGGRAWLHTVDQWPLESWDDGRWRPISLGVRALEFDSRGRPRPTNDFLRLAERDVTGAVADVSEEELRTLLGRQPIRTGLELRGPVALRYSGDVVGRGVGTPRGVVSEIPKARAADLARALGSGGERRGEERVGGREG